MPGLEKSKKRESLNDERVTDVPTMTKKTLLTSEMIIEIVRLYKLSFSWKDIAASIGISRRTLQNWRNFGEKTNSGIYRDLVVAIEKADQERYRAIANAVAIERADQERYRAIAKRLSKNAIKNAFKSYN